MTTQRAHPIVQHTEAVSRRTSLLTLGGAALTTLASRSPEAEAKTRSKAKKKARKKAEKRCRQQGPPCLEFATRLCAAFHPPGSGRDACLNRANACCASIEACDGGEYFACLSEHAEDLAPN